MLPAPRPSNPGWWQAPLSEVRTLGSRFSLVLVKLLNLDHVGIAVTDLNRALYGYRERYGVEPLYREVVAAQGVEEAMLPVGGSFVQLLRPLAADTPVGRFLEKRGEGLHHVAFMVASIEIALDHMREQGARLIDEVARPGGRGARIAFVHPSDLGGTLIELVELPG
jgi:methylmalonyl-CoA/ethylmalonyl-CoA epimerase